MKKMLVLSIVLSPIVLWAVSCGGGAPSAPTGPSASSPPPQTQPPAPSPQPQTSASTTINIVGSAGSGAFTPNPVQVPNGGAIVWRNATGVPHVLVMNDGTPIGTVAPGASITTTLSGGGGNYRCTTHPSMVGSINGAEAPPPPNDDTGY